MVTAKTDSLLEVSFTQFFSRLQTDEISDSDIATILNNGTDDLLRAVKFPYEKSDNVDTIRYRKKSSLFSRFAEPTTAESKFIPIICDNLGISKLDAANLIRDFVEYSFDHSANTIEFCEDLSKVMNMEVLKNFWVKERNAAASCLMTIIKNASVSRNHPLQQTFSKFMEEYRDTVKDVLLKSVTALLKSFCDVIRNLKDQDSLRLQPWWVLELLFCFGDNYPLGTADVKKLLLEFVSLSKQYSTTGLRKLRDVSQSSRYAMDGNEASTLFTAVICRFNDQHRKNAKQEGLSSQSKTCIEDLDAIYKELQNFPTEEGSILLFSWASVVKLQTSAEDESLTEDNGDSGIEHMSNAVSNYVFESLDRISKTNLSINEIVQGTVYKCFCSDVFAFLAGFPPQNFTLTQVEEVVQLSSNLIKAVDDLTKIELGETVWDSEDAEDYYDGPNIVLRLASTVFPQVFRPLISLLTELTVSKRTAAHTTNFLENRLLTVTELSDNYRSSLAALDEDEDRIWDALRPQYGAKVDLISSTCDMVRTGEGDPLFVQSLEEIPGANYRQSLPAGIIGTTDDNLAVVRWVAPWNGFGAIHHILQLMLRSLQHSDIDFRRDETALEELILSTTTSLQLIERIFTYGSETLKEYLSQQQVPIHYISALISELLSSVESSRSTWLAKQKSDELIFASSSCLTAMTMLSSSRAQLALDHLHTSLDSVPVHAVLAALGKSAFPLLSSLSSVTIALTEAPLKSDEIENMLRDEPGKKTFLEEGKRLGSSRPGYRKTSDILCSAGLPLWLSTVVKDMEEFSGDSSQWLLPLWTMRFVADNARVMMNESAPASIFVQIVTSAAASTLDGRITNEDTLLFHALREGLIACYETLKNRHAMLQNWAPQDQSMVGRGENRSGKRQSKEEYVPYEKIMLKPEVIYGLATLSSGRGDKLRCTEFYTKWMSSAFRCYIPADDECKYLFYSSNPNEIESGKVNDWGTWLADISARCLSLSFSCLSKNPFHADVTQVPWPTTHTSVNVYRGGGGDVIRSGYTERVVQYGSIAIIEMLTSVLSNGQRAAARSLFGPQKAKLEKAPVKKKDKKEAEESPTKTKSEKVSKENKKTENVKESEKPVEKSSLINAVVTCLGKSKTSLSGVDSDANSEPSQIIHQNHQALIIAACIRFLRVGWDSHCSKWFQDSWRDLKVWGHLADLLRCEGVNQSKRNSRIDVMKMLDMKRYAEYVTNKITVEQMCEEIDVTKSIHDVTLSVDVASVWKALVSDALQLFSMEIMQKSCAELFELQDSKTTTSLEGGETKLRLKLFQESAFCEFASVFTERWMHVLLRNDFCYLGKTTNTIDDDDSIIVSEVETNPISLEQRAKDISVFIAKKLGLKNSTLSSASNLLLHFRRSGDVRMRFGADYAFDVYRLIKFLRKQGLNDSEVLWVARNVHALNTMITRQDGLVEVSIAFSAITSTSLFTDSFSPNQAAALTYSSPQYQGKLCRYAAWMLGRMKYSLSTSIHSMAVAAEITRLTASLATQLSLDELEQSALTALRFLNASNNAALGEKLSPVAQMCIFCDEALSLMETGKMPQGKRDVLGDIVRWLLITLSRLVMGSAFRQDEDVKPLIRTSINALLHGRDMHTVCAAASVVLNSIFETCFDVQFKDLFDLKTLDVIFSAIAHLSQNKREEAESLVVAETAASLLITIARVQSIGSGWGKQGEGIILRQLSGGCIQAFLPPGDETITAYSKTSNTRHPSHVVWCACLQLASVTIPTKDKINLRDVERESEVRNVLEFCGTNLPRIVIESMDLTGDWSYQSAYSTDLTTINSNGSGIQQSKHITMGRLEEAEVACATIHKLSYFTRNLQEMLPRLLEQIIPKAVQLTSRIIRLLRAEPVERWVRPVTQRERERSYFVRSEREGHTLLQPLHSTPWTRSPSNAGTPISSTPPRRSPLQALRAAIGESGSRGLQTPGSISPSPGSSLTPAQFSPMIASATPGVFTKVIMPASPWGPYGSGLIIASALTFGEEASQSLLRTLAVSLAALQRFCSESGAIVYGLNMHANEEGPGLGVLLTITSYACSEMQRDADGEKREYLQAIADNALHLSIIHVVEYMNQGIFPQSSIDEFRRRLGAIISRSRRLVPPPPSRSLLPSKELDLFYTQLR